MSQLHPLIANLPHSDAAIFFYGSIFSQWAPCSFIDPDTGVVFNCTEQYMMYKKARWFRDREAMDAIMKTDDPAEQKAIGRRVKNFNADSWSRVCREKVRQGNSLKFGQNELLRKALLSTGSRMIVEASPTDCIWGIGLAINDSRIFDLNSWRGTNWLGLCLMDVRDFIQRTTPSDAK